MVWKDVPGYPGYRVSDAGVVESYKSGTWKPIRRRLVKSGHLGVSLYNNGRRWDTCAHVIVMRSFIGPPGLGQEVRHANGDPAVNRLSNLSFGTRKDNADDRGRHGRHHRPAGEANGRRILCADDVRAIRKRVGAGETLRAVASDFGVAYNTISAIMAGRSWSTVK